MLLLLMMMMKINKGDGDRDDDDDGEVFFANNFNKRLFLLEVIGASISFEV